MVKAKLKIKLTAKSWSIAKGKILLIGKSRRKIMDISIRSSKKRKFKIKKTAGSIPRLLSHILAQRKTTFMIFLSKLAIQTNKKSNLNSQHPIG